MCAPDGPRPPPGGRLLVCVPGGYSTPSTIEPAASGRRRFSDVRHLGRVPGAAPGKGPRSKHRSTPWLARNEVALPARAVAHLECGATDRRARERATDSNHLRLARDLVEPPRHQPYLINKLPRRGPVIGLGPCSGTLVAGSIASSVGTIVTETSWPWRSTVTSRPRGCGLAKTSSPAAQIVAMRRLSSRARLSASSRSRVTAACS